MRRTEMNRKKALAILISQHILFPLSVPFRSSNSMCFRWNLFEASCPFFTAESERPHTSFENNWSMKRNSNKFLYDNFCICTCIQRYRPWWCCVFFFISWWTKNATIQNSWLQFWKTKLDCSQLIESCEHFQHPNNVDMNVRISMCECGWVCVCLRCVIGYFWQGQIRTKMWKSQLYIAVAYLYVG